MTRLLKPPAILERARPAGAGRRRPLGRARSARGGSHADGGRPGGAASNVALPTSPTLDADSLVASLAPPLPAARSVAVLKLRHAGAAEDDYLAAGVTEGVVDVLAAASVRARSAPFELAARDPQDVGRELGVDAILSGSVEVDGDLLRVAVRLVGAHDGFALWAGRFDGVRGDALGIATTIGVSRRSAQRSRAPTLVGASRGLREATISLQGGAPTTALALRGGRAAGARRREGAGRRPHLAALALAPRARPARVDTEAAREAAETRAERAIALASCRGARRAGCRLRDNAATEAAT